MANLFKPLVTKTDSETGEKVKVKTKKWYGRYRDAEGTEHRVPLSENKATAQRMLAEIVKQVVLVKSGLAHSAEAEMIKPIGEHIDDFERSLKSRDNTQRYVRDTIMKVRRCIEACRWRTSARIKATDVEKFLVELRDVNGCSIETSNHYLRSIKSFCRWLHVNKRMIENPLLALSLLNSRVDRRRQHVEEYVSAGGRRNSSLVEASWHVFVQRCETADDSLPQKGCGGRQQRMPDLVVEESVAGILQRNRFDGDGPSLSSRSFEMESCGTSLVRTDHEKLAWSSASQHASALGVDPRNRDANGLDRNGVP